MNMVNWEAVQLLRPALRALICIALVLGTSNVVADSEVTYEGKLNTGRSISFQVRVQGTPDQIFRLWISPDGIKSFLGSGSNVD